MEWLVLIFGLVFVFGGAGIIAIGVHRRVERDLRDARRRAQSRVGGSRL